jgi:2,4-dienoyl-CoA reductase (NADPH2)
VPGEQPFDIEPGAVVVDVLDVRTGAASLPADGTIALFDPIGGPIAVALAEEFGERAVLITHDNIAGNELSRTGDLAPANVRLAQRGVQVVKRALLRRVDSTGVTVQDRFSGDVRTIECVALVDCGFRLPAPPLVADARRVGDCVAPRTIAEAVLEARRAAASI